MSNRTSQPENYTEVRYGAAEQAPRTKSVEAAPHLPERRTAVLVAHGMGQQVPFETIDGLARRLRDGQDGAVTVGFLRAGEETLPRAELRVAGEPVDVYEVYWAPVTQGKVLLKDVVNFLLGAGISGFRNAGARGGFERWMFGRWQQLPLDRGKTRFFFLAAAAVFVSLLLINAVVGAAVAVSVFAPQQPPTWLQPELKAALTGALLVAVAGGLVAGLTLAVGHGLRWLMRAGVAVALAGVVLSGLLTLWLIAGHPPVSLPTRDQLGVLAAPWFQWAVWGGVAALGAGARWFILEFVGDVTAYVSAHTVNRYAEVRREIQEIARKTGRLLYSAKDEQGGFLYDRVLVVGHSLGSVIAYDLLNALLRQDLLGITALEVRRRTPLFLTFGSPLNKTAYIFRNQQPREAEIREALAAAIQPMITSYGHRPDWWVNIWSPDDWISGALAYYDGEPAGADAAAELELKVGRKVWNLPDPEARVPGAAHNQYWENPLLTRVLRDALTDPDFHPERFLCQTK